MRTAILGVGFDAVTRAEAVSRAIGFLGGHAPKLVVTANPEIVMLARKNAMFMEVTRRADMVVADGIGVVYASRLNKMKLPERVPGYDLALALFDHMKGAGQTAYFLGAKPGVAEKAAREMERQFPGLRVVGAADGYFDGSREILILEEIRRLKPDLLLVGLGAPRQELWLDRYKDTLPCKLLIGVGGSFDGFSGDVARAPLGWQRLGLEWLYRLITQPSRIRRMGALPAFTAAALWERIRGKGREG